MEMVLIRNGSIVLRDIFFKNVYCFHSIAPKHAIVRMEGDKFTLEPGEPNVRLMHNGKAVVDKVELHHNDR